MPTAPTSVSSHPVGNGSPVTVKKIALLSFMPGSREIDTGPELAPVGTGMDTDESLQELTVAAVLPTQATLLPWELPKPAPLIVTPVPTGPVVVERLAITGAGLASV